MKEDKNVLNEEANSAERADRPVPAVSAGRKAWLEIKDILVGLAFPLIVSIVLSSTILLYAYTADLTLSLIALIGGEIMLVASLVMFGRANGSAAYDKTLMNAQKRELGSTDERVICHTGEYAIWKSIVIALILCAPFIIFQTIELCYHNSFTEFCLKYICGWGYFSCHYLGKQYQALNYILVAMPIAAHTVGYHLGKLRRIKIQELREAELGKKKGRRK